MVEDAPSLEDFTVIGLDFRACPDDLRHHLFVDDREVPAALTALAAGGADRRAVMRLVGVAQGTMEKTVGVVYEQNKRPEGSHHQPWLDQMHVQASAGFDYLEKAATGRAWLHGDGLTLADVNAVAAYDFAGYLPLCQDLVAGGKYPALAELSARCNALPAFAETAWSR